MAASNFTPGVRAMERCDRMGAPPFSEVEGQLVRRFLTPAHRAALDTMTDWMVQAGMTVRLDAAANLIGRYEGEAPDAPALIIASHVDTVRNAGRYDGALGVMLGIDCVEGLNGEGRRLPFAIEVIAFGDEEGSRFPTSMLCSRAVAGEAVPGFAALKDGDGVVLTQAFADFGVPDVDLSGAARKRGDVLAYLEAHIEQGPLLESENLALGVVTAIAAQKRIGVRLTGTAGHAGTTPMGLRRDPGPGAAEAILAVERLCRHGRDSLVGTVGRIIALPGSANVIPGAVDFTLDIRAETSTARDVAVAEVIAEITDIAARRDLGVTFEPLQDMAESPSDPELTLMLEQAIAAVGERPRRLPSGAGHDAMVMAALCPTAMLFIRCKGGVSHNPAEAVTAEDCAIAAKAMLAFIDILGERQP